jgi:hypothetical protein
VLHAAGEMRQGVNYMPYTRKYYLQAVSSIPVATFFHHRLGLGEIAFDDILIVEKQPYSFVMGAQSR